MFCLTKVYSLEVGNNPTQLTVLSLADSKRKMQSVVGYKRDERVFGGEAVNAVSRVQVTILPLVDRN
jgi:molecular chaperone DnaK (HSP70)